MSEVRLIDANVLKDAIIAMDYLSETNLNFICKAIDNAPTVEIPVARWDCYCEGQKVGYEKALSERPQGEWKVYGRQGDIPITDYCTNCKYEMKWYRNKYNFCPNCGAKMKGGAE
jgi:hypothetical protein